MIFDNLLKSSVSEVGNFTNRNAKKFATLADLRTARDGCKTKEARMLIENVMMPLRKELQKEVTNFESRMSKIWKATKGEEVPKDTQKKLDDVMKKGAKTLQSGGEKVKHNSNPNHDKWIDILSMG